MYSPPLLQLIKFYERSYGYSRHTRYMSEQKSEIVENNSMEISCNCT